MTRKIVLPHPCANPSCDQSTTRFKFCCDRCRRVVDNANRPSHGSRAAEILARRGVAQETGQLVLMPDPPKRKPDMRTWAERKAAIRAAHGVKFNEPAQITAGGSMAGAKL